MYQLKIGTIPLPKLYVCSRGEVQKCRELGVPYIIKPQGWTDEKLVKAVLWRFLHDRFPHIKWRELLGFYRPPKLNVFVPEDEEIEELDPIAQRILVSSAPRENPRTEDAYSSPNLEYTEGGEYRETSGGFDEDDKLDFNEPKFEQVSIDDYIGDLGYYVNIEELQKLRVLPTFLDDIANAVKVNIMNTSFMDGYNKKLECNLGSWKGTEQAPNLIILDTSGSIPSGVAGTMISLIDTLRNQANADLIITSRRSEFWPAHSELPNPDKLSYLIGGCNECTQFYAILRDKVIGKHWGNVIIFGDQDSPLRYDIQSSVRRGATKNIGLSELQSTRIDRIMAFHTDRKLIPGYGLWARDASPKAEVVYNTEWVDCMDNDRW